MRTLGSCATAIALASALAGPAAAETPIRSAPPLRIRLSSPYDPGQALKDQGIARTSFDRRLQGVASTASVGFLCGMSPSTQTHGAAGALGVDGEGRFLGAQLKLGFR